MPWKGNLKLKRIRRSASYWSSFRVSEKLPKTSKRRVRSMNKKSLSVLIIGAFLVGISGMAYAMMCNTGSGSGHGDAHAETTEKGSAVNVGNEICPVGGEAVDGM